MFVNIVFVDIMFVSV